MLYLLDKDVKTVKWNGIPLHEASSAIVKEEINGDFTLTVRYPITDTGIYQLIKEDMLIKAPTPVLGPQLFRIKKPVENDDSLDITAYHITDDVMQRSIRPVSVVGQGCAMALSQMVQNAKTDLGTFSFTSDIMDSRTFNTTETETLYSVLLDGKHSIVGTWEGELVRDNFAMSIKRSRGADRGVVITTHKNLKSYQRTKNSQSVVTRIHAKSTFKAEGAEEETTITVTVDSPLIGSYPYINEKDYENNNAKTVDELRKWAEAKFKNEGIDKISDAIEIEAYELDGQVIHLGDTVNIKSKKHSVDIYKKAIAYEFNALTEEYISITFDDKPGVGGSGVSSGVSNAADVILSANKTAQEIAIERAVRNANQAFDAEFDKRVEVINNSIEQSRAEAERHADQIKTEISQEFDTFEHEYQATKQSQSQQIADILAKAQANTILATDAKNIGNQAKADAANALSKAIQYKNEAIAEATRLDTVERQATETKLATAKSQAISEATRLVETAKSLLSGQISNISTDLSQTKEAIKLLATRETVDTLTGRVSSAEAMIQVQADQISQRVKTSDFDQAKQRISTAESSITQLGNRITTEISETVAKIPTEIGSINLLDNTDYKKGITDWIEDGLNRSLQNNYLRLQLLGTLNKRVYKAKDFNHPLTNGETITVSYIAYSSREGVGFSASTYDAMPEKQRVTLNQTPTKYIKTFNLGQSRRLSLFIYGNVGDEVFVKNIQVERGKVASDWRLAPEDFIDEIASVKTITTQTAEGQEQLSTRLTETQGKVSEAETKIRQLVNDVSSKVSQMTFDNLKKTVDSQGTSIIQNQSAIALKAEKNYVDGVKATADSAKSTASDALSKANINAESIKTTKAELQVTSDAVKTKVSQLDFNSVTQRLTNAETSIRTQAGQIEQRLTSTQVEQAITSKGYQTKTQVDNNITGRGYITDSALQPYALYTTVQSLVQETSNSFQRTITETKSLIPVDSVNQNLLITSTEIQKSLLLGNEIYPSPTIGNYDSSTIREAISVSPGDTYTFTKISIPNKDNFWRVTYLDSSKNFHSRFPNQSDKFTITIPAGVFYMWVSYPNNSNSKIEKGNKATPYSISVLDTATVTALHSVKDTVNSHTRTIGEQGNSLSQVIQTAQGLVTRVNNLKPGNRNYLLDSKATTINMTGVTDTGTWDTPINISADFWKHDDVYKNQKIRLSLYYQSSVAYSTSRTFPVHFRKSPWYQIGTITYPAGSTRPVKYEFTFGTMPSGFDASQIFIRFDRALDRGRVHTIERAQLEVSDMFSDWSPAPEDGDQAIQAVSTQVNTLAGSWSVQNLNSSGDILSQANLSSAQFLLEAAKIRLKGKTLADEIQAIDGKFGTLFVADGTFAKLNANVIDSQAITADKLKVDQAFFTKFMANDAYLKQLFTKSAFITQVQAVTMSASQISGGILTATNGAMQVNLNAGKIMYYTDQAALKRVLTGYPTQFVKFATGTVSGKGNAGVTVIGSNRWNSESSNDGGFVGIRAWNGANIDSLDLVGDEIRLASSAFDNPDGWDVKTLDSGLRIAPHNRAAERNSRIEVGDVWIMKGNGTYSSLRDILNAFNGNFSKGPNADSYTYYPNGF
ncbi:matrix-binding protein EbhB [Streptococcus suis]|uniref:phage tail spike protein n=1 Tax=Streptococcus suis TaxID=1307 RepID=UPI001DEB4A89|nr:phage tail spike protein [Streptococcus suis]MBS8015031.1 matrix-binding protein EbhB [Streptococcus suis]